MFPMFCNGKIVTRSSKKRWLSGCIDRNVLKMQGWISKSVALNMLTSNNSLNLGRFFCFVFFNLEASLSKECLLMTLAISQTTGASTCLF